MAIQSIHDMGQVHLGNHGQEDHVWPDGKWPLPDEKKMQHTPGDMGDDLALLDPLLNLLICFHCFQWFSTCFYWLNMLDIVVSFVCDVCVSSIRKKTDYTDLNSLFTSVHIHRPMKSKNELFETLIYFPIFPYSHYSTYIHTYHIISYIHYIQYISFVFSNFLLNMLKICSKISTYSKHAASGVMHPPSGWYVDTSGGHWWAHVTCVFLFGNI